MANKTTPGNSQDKRKAFDQGNGDNSTTADQSKTNNRPGPGNYKENEEGGKRKPTNQDTSITHRDQPVNTDESRKMPMDDDADTISQKPAPEINPPQQQPEKTERKLPEM